MRCRRRTALSAFRLPASLLVIALLCTVAPSLAQTTDQSQAELHHKVALIALKDGNLSVARRELEAAAKPAPQNALIQYPLAIVNQKSGRADAGLEHLEQALSLGLLPDVKKSAEDLLPTLLYEKQKTESSIDNYTGVWRARRHLSGTLADEPDTYSTDEEFTLTVAGDTGRLSGLLTVSEVTAQGNGTRFTREIVADLTISEGRDGIQAVINSARVRVNSDLFKDLPAANVRFVLHSDNGTPTLSFGATSRPGFSTGRVNLTK
jgi:hypothetical protein